MDRVAIDDSGSLGLATAFKSAMRRLASSVCVVTCLGPDGKRRGITATAVSSLSLEPPALLVCVNQVAPFHSELVRAEYFGVNILSRDHVEVSRNFGGAAKGDARFEVGRWQGGIHDVPILADAQANLICGTERKIEYGTHSVFIGRVVQASVSGDVDALIYQDGKYATAVAL